MGCFSQRSKVVQKGWRNQLSEAQACCATLRVVWFQESRLPYASPLQILQSFSWQEPPWIWQHRVICINWIGDWFTEIYFNRLEWILKHIGIGSQKFNIEIFRIICDICCQGSVMNWIKIRLIWEKNIFPSSSQYKGPQAFLYMAVGGNTAKRPLPDFQF